MVQAMIGGDRAVRVCDACGGVDDHPRHVIAGPPDAYPAPDDDTVAKVMANARKLNLDDIVAARLLRDLLSTAAVDLHMDCCRARGCPTGACDTQTAGAEDARGAKLLKHLVGIGPGFAEVGA